MTAQSHGGYEAQCWAIKNHLRMLAAVEPPDRSVSAFLLEHGRFFTPGPRPRSLRRGQVKQCFANSQKAALRSARSSGDLTYVEGFACSGGLSVNLPLLHGWLSDGEGNVVDLTWEFPEDSAYFGVAFTADYVEECSGRRPIDSLLDARSDGWRLLRDPELAAGVIRKSSDETLSPSIGRLRAI